jgi:tetratricopeptide (TPR) repeat protein/DNA-binding CsgD family transcriptional regulator
MQEALAVPLQIQDDEFLMVTFNNLGLAYMRQMKYDSAIIAYKESYKIARKQNVHAYMAVTTGNMGFAYFKKGDDETALPLLEADFDLSDSIGEINSATNASLTLSTIYLKKGNRPKAEFYVQYSKKHVERANNKQMRLFYDNLSELSKIMKDYQSALIYKDSADFYYTRVLSVEEKDIIERARLELEIEKHAHSMSTLEAERKKQIITRNAILIALILSGILGSMLIHKRFLRRKRELESAQRELNQFTEMVREKNELLENFSREIELMKLTDQHMTDERTRHLTELIHSHILTEDDWNQFRILFDKVNPGFFIRLKEKMPDLTSAETRLLALTKLQLAPREMASMLGISYDSILKSRQRLRKKINLSEEGSLDELLEMI